MIIDFELKYNQKFFAILVLILLTFGKNEEKFPM